jgi:hypothetical protein
MKKKRRFEIQDPNNVLGSLPSDVAKSVAEVLGDFDPSKPPGKKVEQVASAGSSCPNCGGPLLPILGRGMKAIKLPASMGGRTIDLVECRACDLPFEIPAGS